MSDATDVSAAAAAAAAAAAPSPPPNSMAAVGDFMSGMQSFFDSAKRTDAELEECKKEVARLKEVNEQQGATIASLRDMPPDPLRSAQIQQFEAELARVQELYEEQSTTITSLRHDGAQRLQQLENQLAREKVNADALLADVQRGKTRAELLLDDERSRAAADRKGADERMATLKTDLTAARTVGAGKIDRRAYDGLVKKYDALAEERSDLSTAFLKLQGELRTNKSRMESVEGSLGSVGINLDDPAAAHGKLVQIKKVLGLADKLGGMEAVEAHMRQKATFDAAFAQHTYDLHVLNHPRVGHIPKAAMLVVAWEEDLLTLVSVLSHPNPEMPNEIHVKLAWPNTKERQAMSFGVGQHPFVVLSKDNMVEQLERLFSPINMRHVYLNECREQGWKQDAPITIDSDKITSQEEDFRNEVWAAYRKEIFSRLYKGKDKDMYIVLHAFEETLTKRGFFTGNPLTAIVKRPREGGAPAGSRKRRVLSHAGSEGDAEPMPPKAPATQFAVGTHRASEDGSVWVTAVNGNSSNFWKRCEVEDAD